MPLNVFLSILWKVGVSLRKEYKIVTWKCHLHSYNRNNNLDFTIETVVHRWEYHLHKYNKNVTHIFDAETVTCVSAAETNWRIATETVTCMIATERSTSITVKWFLKKSLKIICSMKFCNLNECKGGSQNKKSKFFHQKMFFPYWGYLE